MKDLLVLIGRLFSNSELHLKVQLREARHCQRIDAKMRFVLLGSNYFQVAGLFRNSRLWPRAC